MGSNMTYRAKGRNIFEWILVSVWWENVKAKPCWHRQRIFFRSSSRDRIFVASTLLEYFDFIFSHRVFSSGDCLCHRPGCFHYCPVHRQLLQGQTSARASVSTARSKESDKSKFFCVIRYRKLRSPGSFASGVGHPGIEHSIYPRAELAILATNPSTYYYYRIVAKS